MPKIRLQAFWFYPTPCDPALVLTGFSMDLHTLAEHGREHNVEHRRAD